MARQARRTTRRNPPLAVFGNPRGGLRLSSRVYSLAYKHTEDGRDYKHDFSRGVCCELLPDGSVRIYHKNGKPLWGDF